MIADLYDQIKTTMRGLGYELTDNEDAPADRRYRIVIGSASNANEVRGGLSSGRLRVNWEISIRVQYSGDLRVPQRDRQIAIDLEQIALRLYIDSGRAALQGLAVESVDGGGIAVVSMLYDGSIV